MDDSWYPPELDYNLPEDNDYIFNLTLEIRSMMLETDRYKHSASLTNEQKRSKIREVRQAIMRTYGEIERERRKLLRQYFPDLKLPRPSFTVWCFLQSCLLASSLERFFDAFAQSSPKFFRYIMPRFLHCFTRDLIDELARKCNGSSNLPR